MFDRLLLKNRAGYGPLIDVGTFAEALVFYGHVELICNSATLEYLVKRIPAKIFLDLMKTERITAYLLKDQLGVSTVDRANGGQAHGFIKMALHSPDFEESAERALKKSTSDRHVIKQVIKQLHPIGHQDFDDRWLISALTDVETTKEMVSAALKTMVPGLMVPSDFRFLVHRESGGLFVDTNLNLEEANRLYHQVVPKAHSSITHAWLLSLLQGVHENMYFAANFRSEVANGAIEQAVLKEALQSLATKMSRGGKDQIDAFNSVVLNGHSIREAVNSGSVSFSEVLKLTDKVQKFREWLDGKPEDADLLREYHQACIANTWIEKLPAKVIRWSVFSGIGVGIDTQLGSGIAATVVAQGLSAVDTFFVDKVLRGWKPNQFVESEIIPLLQK